MGKSSVQSKIRISHGLNKYLGYLSTQLNKIYNEGLVILDILMQKDYILYYNLKTQIVMVLVEVNGSPKPSGFILRAP